VLGFGVEAKAGVGQELDEVGSFMSPTASVPDEFYDRAKLVALGQIQRFRRNAGLGQSAGGVRERLSTLLDVILDAGIDDQPQRIDHIIEILWGDAAKELLGPGALVLFINL
jgi:hypothetical protein